MAVTDRRPEEASEEDLATMTLWEHLTELRNRILVCVVALIVMTIVAWFFYNPAIDFMKHPYCHYLATHPDKRLVGCRFVTSGPMDGFLIRLKVSVYGGFALSTPISFWELWAFITPGLRKNEKRYAVPFVVAAVVLFAMGVTTAILIFPKALTWLINISGHNIAPLFQPQQYFMLYVVLCVIFGVVFMYPLVVVGLELTGVVPSRRWRKWRRPAIVVLCIVAAVATPSSDPFSFMAMAIPMVVLYEVSIIVGRVLRK